jgi:hypothetical protein
MKIEIDTNKKTVILGNGLNNLGEVFDLLGSLFPTGEWKNYSLDVSDTIIVQHSPIVINRPNPYVPNSPWTTPWITYSTSTGTSATIELKEGINSFLITDNDDK